MDIRDADITIVQNSQTRLYRMIIVSRNGTSVLSQKRKYHDLQSGHDPQTHAARQGLTHNTSAIRLPLFPYQLRWPQSQVHSLLGADGAQRGTAAVEIPAGVRQIRVLSRQQ